MSRLKSVKLKADLSLYNQGKTCSDCRHFIDKDIYGYHCKLTSLILKGIPCQFFNREITGLKVCYNCKHFLSRLNIVKYHNKKRGDTSCQKT